MKLQITFRKTNRVENGFDVAMMAGIIEYPAHAAPREMIATFSAPFRPEASEGARPSSFKDSNWYRRPEASGLGILDCGSMNLSDLVTSHIWRKPEKYANCELFLRETRMEPSETGLVVMAFSGIVGVQELAGIDESSVLQYSFDEDAFLFEGIVGEDLRPEWGSAEMKERTRGNSLTAFLRQPVWGFMPSRPLSHPL